MQQHSRNFKVYNNRALCGVWREQLLLANTYAPSRGAPVFVATFLFPTLSVPSNGKGTRKLLAYAAQVATLDTFLWRLPHVVQLPLSLPVGQLVNAVINVGVTASAPVSMPCLCNVRIFRPVASCRLASHRPQGIRHVACRTVGFCANDHDPTAKLLRSICQSLAKVVEAWHLPTFELLAATANKY